MPAAGRLGASVERLRFPHARAADAKGHDLRQRHAACGTRVSALALTSFTATSAIGRGLEATLASLRAQRSGLTPCRFETAALETCVGEVAGVDEVRLPR